MTKLEEMQNKLMNLISDMQQKLDADRLDEAEKIRDQIKALKNKIDNQIFLDELESQSFQKKAKEIPQSKQTAASANFIRACIKKFSNKALTPQENELLVQNSLLLPTTSAPNGTNGEAYILPQDIQTIITAKKESIVPFVRYWATTRQRRFRVRSRLKILTASQV